MRFRMSPNVAVRTDRFTEAVGFYSEVLGFKVHSVDADLADLDASPLRLIVIEDQDIYGPGWSSSLMTSGKPATRLQYKAAQYFAGKGKGRMVMFEIPSE